MCALASCGSSPPTIVPSPRTVPFALSPSTNSRRNTSAGAGSYSGSVWPPALKSTYDTPRSWCTMPAGAPSSANQGVAGRREKPCVPPKVRFWMTTSVPRCGMSESSLPE
ncbi:hypothetical protein GSI_09388 [Ganoderma sinense ZZ0214-1]|uniref:Uncharacterized protein n=1 Tax=Ganoderma sinense ZZ0214-1 TaxID=1077348 RepID=A0A2G8S6H5_9APHY|nr:hypothetical protein GSI_09388 [Ganoderma sinense ZZ0214-1]